MPKFVIRTAVTALHRRVIFIDSPNIRAAADQFIAHALNGDYNTTPERIEFDTDSATFEVESAESYHPDQYSLGLFH